MYERCPNGCDDLMLFSCELDSENDAIIYRCSVCDWKKVEHNPFYGSAWIVSVNQALASIDILQSLLTNGDVVEFLRPRLKGKSFLNNRASTAWEFTAGSDNYLQGEVETAYQVYLRQMNVLAATYTELILKDFFDSFFVAKPSELIELLAKKEAFKKRIVNEVSFDKIMSGEAKETMINHAFNSMRREDSWRVIKDLAERTPTTFDRKLLFDRLKSLITERDDIVHNSLYSPFDSNEINVQKVYDNFKFIINLVCVLEKIAEANDIPCWKEFDCKFDEFIK